MAEKKNADVNQVKDPGDQEENLAAAPKGTREFIAVGTVKRYMYWAMGAGLIPVPLLDLGALAGVQLKMLESLSRVYKIPFSKSLVKSIIAALLGTATAETLRWSPLTGFIRSIPLIGIIGTVSLSIYGGATTYAIGKVFITHFESGGTFLDFDPEGVKNFFRKLCKEGKLKAS